MLLYKAKLFILTLKKIAVFERQKKVSLSTLNQRQTFTLKER